MPREGDQLLVSTLEFLPDATFVIDRDKRIVGWNRACEVMTGVPKEALLGKGDYAYAEPFFGERRPILIDLLDAPAAEVEELHQDVRRRGDTLCVETFAPHLRGGEGAQLHGEAVALFDKDGRRCGALQVIRDVTEQKRVEQALRESAVKHRTLFENASDAIFLMRNDRFIDCNARTLAMFGCTREQIVGAPPYEFSPPLQPDGRPSDEKALEKINLALTEGPQRFEWEHCRKDGTRFAAEVSLNRLELGEEVLLQAIVRDVSERKRIEEALVASEREYRELVMLANSIILRWDRDGRITFLNEFGQRFFGYTQAEILGRNVLGTIVPESESTGRDLRNLMEEIRADPAKFEHGANENIRRDGERVWIDWTNRVVRDERGEIREILSIGSDITARLRSEKEREMLEEQLRVSQKMEAIGRLAGGVAHDFNNLLTVINGTTEILEVGLKEGDPLRAELEEIRIAGGRAAALTRQLLAFSRRQVLQPAHLNLNQIATGVEKMLRRILGEDIDFVQVLAPDLGLTLADPGQIEQVLMNLVVNARDAMAEGGELTIETSNVDVTEERAARDGAMKPGRYVQLAVTDTGCGMNEETQARLFEPFFTTKKAGKGTGLGLSTVYGIVKQSEGNIRVYSEPGVGTTFRIYLPREPSDTAAASVERSKAPTPATGTETILVVEDEEGLRKIATRCLTAAGYKVVTAANGEEALLTCAQYADDIHLLLTDVVMPRMNGRQLAQELTKARPALRVVYMSGYTEDAILHHGVLDEGTYFLAKPFTVTDLTRKVRDVLDLGAARPGDGPAQSRRSESPTGDQPSLTPALPPLPPDDLARLRRAVVAARYNDIVNIAEALRATDPTLATELRRFAERVDYA